MRAISAKNRWQTSLWFDVARNVVTYADASGEYAELAAYMKRHSLL